MSIYLEQSTRFIYPISIIIALLRVEKQRWVTILMNISRFYIILKTIHMNSYIFTITLKIKKIPTIDNLLFSQVI